MGRLNSALAEQVKETGALAQWLRTLRKRSGLTYSQMAQKTIELSLPVSIATLSRADEGRSVPTWRVTEAYTRACGGSVRTAERLWLRADANRPGRRKRGRGAASVTTAGRALRYVTDRAELYVEMKRLWLRSGSPSLRELEARAVRDGVSRLPKSTLHGVLAGERDCTERILVEFVRACGATSEEETEWVEALRRVAYGRDGGGWLSEVEERLAEAEAEILWLRESIGRAAGDVLAREPAAAVDVPVPLRRWRSRPPAVPPQVRPPQRPAERAQ
ncbi:helix-turn-helix domain-containing protein [Streptomyces sp. SP17BM10]|uniref:helix-turn-helix domain-containing protein n=1 Tax=Streptomyces sp. SP17BM10 TaxID=3002530 RepID=UPI002E7A6587|nr:helix-turn-helix domain-containing protein [Streptomyces sp. SP17BM10]MEE1783132.1 helix-turn-helix domain-containing protein [Streptomyces sp. SP17BM10]